jgi:transcriptional regulator with XRE-family HTH domain
MAAEHDAVGREPNRLLSAARRARRLTQQQLAEAVGAAHWRLFDREAAIDADRCIGTGRATSDCGEAGYQGEQRPPGTAHLYWTAVTTAAWLGGSPWPAPTVLPTLATRAGRTTAGPSMADTPRWGSGQRGRLFQ